MKTILWVRNQKDKKNNNWTPFRLAFFKENPIRPLMSHQRRIHFKLALFLSILLHTLVNGVSLLLPDPQHPTTNNVDLEIIDSSNPLAEQQIVYQNEKSLNNEIPKNAQFLSATNQAVKNQTIAQKRGQFHNGQGEKSRKAYSDYQPTYDWSGQKKLESPEAPPAESPQKQAKNSGGTGESQTLDYIKELDPGLETLLSTREFVYYTFYQRIRNQLNQYWVPKVREKLTKIYHQGRNIASDQDKITKCLITLDRNGKLIKVQIIGISGYPELDEAAVEAFRSAAPFPNPPSGMIDGNGMILIRWDFILEA